MQESNENPPYLEQIIDITKSKTEGKKETKLIVPIEKSESFSSGENMADPKHNEDKEKEKLIDYTAANEDKEKEKSKDPKQIDIAAIEDKEKEKSKDPKQNYKGPKEETPKENVAKEGILDKIKKHWKIILLLTLCIFTLIIYAGLIGHIFNIIDGNWSEWGNWSQCSATCGYGLTNRIRKCSGKYCPGQNVEYQMCNLKTCTDGSWSEWGNWSQCSVTCGHGLRNRIRTCSVEHCPGQNVEYQSCNLITCTDRSWSEWGSWSQCSVTCGHGLRNRIRTCSVEHCPGQNVEYQMCPLITCTGDIAAFSWKFKIQNGILTFPDRPHDNGKIYEHGNGFNPDTGVFTSSIPGIYLFSVTLVKEESNSNLTCHLYKTEPYPSSNQLISLILNSSNYSSNSYSYASATVIVDLKRNDTVYISSCSASSSSSKAYSVFSGVLLHQII